MKTVKEQEKQQFQIKQDNREQKLEMVVDYFRWEDRGHAEKHITWEQWCHIKFLRKENIEKQEVKNKKFIDSNNFLLTSFGIKININNTKEKTKKYIQKLDKQYYELQKYDTKTLLNTYKYRSRTCYNDYDILFNGKYYYLESFKFVLNTREHIELNKKIKKQLRGKKDRKHGRKNIRK